MTLKDDSLQKIFFHNIYQSWKDELYCDVTIICGTDSVKAQKLVLSSISDYFKFLFQYDDRKIYSFDENIVSGQCLRDIITFSQTGELEIEDDYVFDLCVAADYLQIDLIKSICEDFIRENMHKFPTETIVQFVHFSNTYRLESLIDPICRNISEAFHEMIQGDSFYKLTPFDMKTMLQNENLSVFDHGIPVDNPEYDILLGVGEYLTRNKCDDVIISELLEEIHLEEFDNPEDLKSIITKVPIVDCAKIQNSICIKEIVSLGTNRELKPDLYIDNSRIYSKRNKRLTSNGFNYDLVLIDNWNIDPVTMNDLTTRPTHFKIWVTNVPDDSYILEGISIKYQNGSQVSFRNVESGVYTITEHEFTLQKGEVITQIKTKSGSFLKAIAFYSNYGKTYGPFGDPGLQYNVQTPPSARGYFHSLSGSGTDGILLIKFRWVYFCGKTEYSLNDDDDDDDNDSDNDNNDDYSDDSDDRIFLYSESDNTEDEHEFINPFGF